MDMSLDEIIKKKNIGKNSVKKGFVSKTTTKPILLKKSFNDRRIIDARHKIIQNNREKIRDARDKLISRNSSKNFDARSRLLNRKLVPKYQQQQNYVQQQQPSRNNARIRSPPPSDYYRTKYTIDLTKPPLTIGAPAGYVDYDNMMEEEYKPEDIYLRRTVHNDILPQDNYHHNHHHHHNHSSYDRSEPLNYDPFDAFDFPRSYDDQMRKVRNISPEMTKKRIPRSPSPTPPPSSYHRRFEPETSQLSYSMRNRLERAPDPHQSMGIFSNPLKSQSAAPSLSTYRIVVSNLHSSVTQSDIKELFEDIGELLESRLVRPGVAEVIFNNLKDAEKAVDTYHNRQLDGQPMKCLLVNPRSSNKITAPSSRSSNKTPLEIDIDALHKVLFRRN